ncbi:MAG: YdeI/OmpD-associated family protein [Eggerthellaceae bacterium]|nr:YdeI/OmpD-associated family protein [Eggerthellaceae bacterium]
MPSEPVNILGCADRAAFRNWLADNHDSEPECWIVVKRGRPTGDGAFYYLDAVEEALCFGWVDSVQKPIAGVRMQRFSPRKPRSPWTELNKERARRLERLGLMTDAGRAALPAMGPRSFRIDPDIERALKDARAWSKFKSFPPLYQRVRAYNVAFYKKRDPQQYAKSLQNLVAHTKRGEMFGEWNDYGRLL